MRFKWIIGLALVASAPLPGSELSLQERLDGWYANNDCRRLISNEAVIAMLWSLTLPPKDKYYVRHELTAIETGDLLLSLTDADRTWVYQWMAEPENVWTRPFTRRAIRAFREKFGDRADALLRLVGVDSEVLALLERPTSASEFRKLREERKNYYGEFFFWPSHSTNHMTDIFQNVARIGYLLPEGSEAPYAFLFESSPQGERWRSNLFLASIIHDFAVERREEHATLAFLQAEILLNEFSQGWSHNRLVKVPTSRRERFLVGLIAMLHSKSMIPGDRLAEWYDILVRGKPCPDCRFPTKLLRSPLGDTAISAIHDVTKDEIEKITRSAQLLRIADINRPRGPQIFVPPHRRNGLVNNAGYRFLIDGNSEVFVDVRKASYMQGTPLYPPPHEQFFLYGHVALGNPEFWYRRSPGKFTIPVFHWDKDAMNLLIAEVTKPGFVENTHRVKQVHERVEALKAVNPRAASLLFWLTDILTDYPPEMRKGARVEFVFDGLGLYDPPDSTP